GGNRGQASELPVDFLASHRAATALTTERITDDGHPGVEREQITGVRAESRPQRAGHKSCFLASHRAHFLYGKLCRCHRSFSTTLTCDCQLLPNAAWPFYRHVALAWYPSPHRLCGDQLHLVQRAYTVGLAARHITGRYSARRHYDRSAGISRSQGSDLRRCS